MGYGLLTLQSIVQHANRYTNPHLINKTISAGSLLESNCFVFA